MNSNQNTGVVYSTELGQCCPAFGKPAAQCVCRTNKQVNSTDGIVRVHLETKGRKGSGVTVVTGIPLDEQSLKKLASQLKQKCGTGGTVKSGVLDIQGDKRLVLAEELSKGYTVNTSTPLILRQRGTRKAQDDFFVRYLLLRQLFIFHFVFKSQKS